MLAEGDVPDFRTARGAVASGDVEHDDELVGLFVGVLRVLLGRRLAVAEVPFPRGDLADGLVLEGDEGVSGLFDGAVGPVGDGPRLDAEARAARGGEAHGRGGLHGALRPRDTPTDADGSGGGEVAEPVKRDGVGGENGEGK